MHKKSLIISLLIAFCTCISAQNFRHKAGTPLRVLGIRQSPPVVQTALQLLTRDVKNVLGDTTIETSLNPDIFLHIQPTEQSSDVLSKKQAFRLEVKEEKLHITGSDALGLAYGILEVSRLLGVSPWEWWADLSPEQRTEFILPKDYLTEQSPSVEYRGIFINDEDWGILPWSSQTYEPENGKGVIGPKTNARIFELLLRLRANCYWPAMHACTQPFFLHPGNREMAEKYGIFIGSSHCEPMACCTLSEWPIRGQGEYNYISNSAKVRQFWESRVEELKNQPIIYTLGMRGLHDGKMVGPKSLQEQTQTLQQVIDDQRKILKENVNSDLSQIPQVFIPYKEVLDLYNNGLQVPEDVCLMWCDDNYGYIRHFPTPSEQERVGGNGLYYHISYWGRPHDYLWLGTFLPRLLQNQLRYAYDQGIQKMWILNVGDIKPAEYQIELFCDMAWNIDQITPNLLSKHLEGFLSRAFGPTLGPQLAPIMERSYELAFERRPEFLGNTRTEEKEARYKIIRDFPWTEEQIRCRLYDYANLSQHVKVLADSIPDSRKDAYFQLVQYPILAADQMNRKLLIGQLARHGRAKWSKCDDAYDSIQSLTKLYNKGFFNNGKWMGIMNANPRNLPVFQQLNHVLDATPMLEEEIVHQWKSPQCWTPMVGRNETITTEFHCNEADSLRIEISMLPTHSLDGGNQRYEVMLNKLPISVQSIQTKGRSEEWKMNVLANRSTKTIVVPTHNKNKFILRVKALDSPLFLEEIVVKKAK